MPQVIFENETYTGKELSPDEEAILRKAVGVDRGGGFLAAKGSFYDQLLRDNFDRVRASLMVAKERLDAPFTGLSASDSELGIQKIRPGHILRDAAATEDALNSWSFSFTTAGDYYVGYDASNTTAVNIDKEACLLVLGVMFTQGSQPVVEDLLIQVGSITYPIVPIRDAWAADNAFGVRGVPIRPIILVPKATTLWRTYSIAAGVNELVLLGVTFGFGRYLRTQIYTTIST